MGELSPDLFQSIWKTLRLCEDVFFDQRDLSNLFNDERLENWRDDLPEAATIRARAERAIHYLRDQANHRGESALYLLMLVLSERYQSTDMRYILLRQHMLALHPPVSSPQEEKEPEVTVSTLLPIPYENPFISVHELENIQRCGRSVALIKVQHIHQGIAEYEETGTAWLIAPGLAVTCWHIVATLENPQQPARTAQEVIQQINNLQLYFDKTDSSGGGIAYRIQTLEYPQQNVPTHDFAVLRIEDRSDHPYRQFAYLSIERDTAFTRQTRLSILQHPWGEQQQETHGSFVAYSEAHTAIRYTAETRPGTSGSPVLSRDNWFVTAMHTKRIESTNLGEGIHIGTLLDILQKEQPRLYEEIMSVQFPGKHPLGLLGLSPHNHLTTSERKLPEASRNLPSLTTKKSAYQALPHSYTNKIDNYTYFHTIINKMIPSPLCMAFTQHNLAFSGQGGTIVQLGIPTLHEVATIVTLMPAVTSLASNSSGRFLAVGGADGAFLLWDLKTSQHSVTLQLFTDGVGSIIFSPQGDNIVSSSENGLLKMCAVSNGVTQQQWTNLSDMSSPIFAFQPGLIASASTFSAFGDKASALAPPAIWIVQAPKPTCLLFSPLGGYLACGTESGALIVYDVATRTPLHTLALHQKAIRCLAFHPEETVVASAGDDQVIHLWHVVTGKHIQAIERDAVRIRSLAFSPDGQLLASLDSDPKLILWTAGTK